MVSEVQPPFLSPLPQKRLSTSSLDHPPNTPRPKKSCDQVNQLILENLEFLYLPYDNGAENTCDNRGSYAVCGLQLVQQGSQDNALMEAALRRMWGAQPDRPPLSSLFDRSSSRRNFAMFEHNADKTASAMTDQITAITPLKGPPETHQNFNALSA